jgi:signal transduction histidine kinase
MSNPAPDHFAVWEHRERRARAVIPYAMLAFSAALTVFIRESAREPFLLDLALCGLAAVWMLCLYTLVPAWRDRPVGWTVFFPGLIAIMTVLIIRDPWFGFFTFTGYFFVVSIPPGRWRLLAVAAVAVLTGTSQAGGFSTAASGRVGLIVYTGCVLVNLVIAGAFTWFGWVSYAMNARRAEMVEELSEANQRLEATLTENAGLHEQLLTQAREAGILDERQRMAREIHDTLAQGLAGIITQLQAVEQASDDPVERRRHFEAATRLARDSLAEARRSVDELRPEPLERARLDGALRGVAERWSALNAIPVQVTTTGTDRTLRPETELALLRTAQEALANVAKHAEATRVGLTLSYMDEEVVLDVRDDGRGFDPAGVTREPAYAGTIASADGGDVVKFGGSEHSGDDWQTGNGHHPAPPGGFGLVAMRQRIEGVSGTLQVESEPGGGTAISACVPVQSAGSRA